MNNNKYRVLAVEDDRSVSSLLKALLAAQGYETLLADSCAQGLMMFSSHVPDLVILDLGLPDADGLTFIRQVRQHSSVPILVLSARTTERDKITALDLGANDYITKPFSSGEMLARIRAALRSGRFAAAVGAPRSQFALHDLVVNYDQRAVTIAGEGVHLTQTEFNLLALLCDHAGTLLTYAAMNEALWGAADPGGVKKLQVNMANLRRKLGIKPGDDRYIVKELGVGYRMNLGE